MRLKAARSTNEKLRTYNEVVKILIDSEVQDAAVRAKVFGRFNRDYLQQVVEETESHLRPHNDEAIDLFAQRYSSQIMPIGKSIFGAPLLLATFQPIL